VTSPSVFNSNEELCDNSMRITIKMLRSCRLELSELNQIFLLLVTSSVPDSWKSETNRSHLQRIQKVTNSSIQKTMSNIDSTGLPRFVNVLRLLAQLKELTPKWSNSSQSWSRPTWLHLDFIWTSPGPSSTDWIDSRPTGPFGPIWNDLSESETTWTNLDRAEKPGPIWTNHWTGTNNTDQITDHISSWQV